MNSLGHLLVNQIADALGVTHRKSDGSFVWNCPLHEDKKKSFQCSVGEKQPVVLRCFSKCSSYQQLRAHFRGIGIDIPGGADEDLDFTPPTYVKQKKEREQEPGEWRSFDTDYGEFSFFVKEIWEEPSLAKVYPYRDFDGTLVKFQVRFNYWIKNEDGSRTFEGKDIRKYKRELGKNKHGWKGTKDIPYRFDEIVKAAALGRPIYLLEGEKDADNVAEQWGFATTTIGSASNCWQTDWCEKLKGTKGFIVVADNDGLTKKVNTGLQTAHKNAAILRNAQLPVKLIMFPHVKDATDYIEAGGTKEEFLEIQKTTPLWTPPDYNVPASIAPPPPTTEEEAAKPEWERIQYFPDTDAANAERFAHFYGDVVCYVPELGKWFVFNGKFWEEDKAEKTLTYGKTIGKRIIASIKHADWNVRESLQKWGKNSQQISYVKRMLACAQELLIRHLNEFDSPDTKHLLNCEDGVVNLRTGELEPHNPKHYLTKMSPYKFSKREPELWLKHLRRTFNNDEELVNYFQALCGYSFTGYTSFKKFQMWYGPSDSGKSITQDVLFLLAGSYAGSLDSTSLMETKVRSAGAEDDIARTKGARIIFAPEVKKSHVLDESVVKAITGGDPINVKFMHSAKFPLRGTGKLIFTGNERFQTGSNEPIQKRKLEIPFLCVVEQKDMIEDYDELMLQQEGDAILGWVAEGARRVLAKEVNLHDMPAAVKKQTEEAREESVKVDVCEDFIDTCVMYFEGGREAIHDVYQKFVKYAHECGVHKPPAKWAFGRAMMKHGYAGDGWLRLSSSAVKKAYKDIQILEP